jgi:2'-5' RNA ligase
MKMRVAIALLMPDVLCNRLAPITLRCRDYGFGLRVLRLPAHVSLKQPFSVPDFESFAHYFNELAARIERQRLRFAGFQFWGTADQGVVVIRVVASPRLRQLHAQLNAELAAAFGETQAEHDGEAYAFHLTVAIGACRAEQVPHLQADLATWTFPEDTVASKLALFLYEETPQPDPLYGVREYGTYRVLPLQEDPPRRL